jgi:hypothetical protein
MNAAMLLRRASLILSALVLVACASSETLVRHKTEAYAKSKDPGYLAGFSDGCTSGYAKSSIMVKAAYTRDEARFSKDRQYAAGWDDGRLQCNYPSGSPTFLIGQ